MVNGYCYIGNYGQCPVNHNGKEKYTKSQTPGPDKLTQKLRGWSLQSVIQQALQWTVMYGSIGKPLMERKQGSDRGEGEGQGGEQWGGCGSQAPISHLLLLSSVLLATFLPRTQKRPHEVRTFG